MVSNEALCCGECRTHFQFAPKSDNNSTTNKTLVWADNVGLEPTTWVHQSGDSCTWQSIYSKCRMRRRSSCPSLDPSEVAVHEPGRIDKRPLVRIASDRRYGRVILGLCRRFFWVVHFWNFRLRPHRNLSPKLRDCLLHCWIRSTRQLCSLIRLQSLS